MPRLLVLTLLIACASPSEPTSSGGSGSDRASASEPESEPESESESESVLEPESESESASASEPESDRSTETLAALRSELPAGGCCGDDECTQQCASPADCPRCRPLCGADHLCAAPEPPRRPECRRDADCVLTDEEPCSWCGCPSYYPSVWSRRALRRAIRANRHKCGGGNRPRGLRCGGCRTPTGEVYVPDEAICAEGLCVGHGGGLRPANPLEGDEDTLQLL